MYFGHLISWLYDAEANLQLQNSERDFLKQNETAAIF